MASNRQNQDPVSSSIIFFKIILSPILQRGEIKMPNEFTRKFGDGLPDPVFLQVPDGTRWDVNWTKRNDGIWFEKGWKEFAKHYSLNHGHMVLFDYKESSNFDVRIFDMSTFQIEYPFRRAPSSMELIHHPVSSSILFFKIILTTTLQSGKLKMPNKFTRIYGGGGLPNPVLLKPPDGTEWRVHWTKRDDGIWFEKGWKEFATRYSLENGHMILFDYKENSHFEVLIFDMTAVQTCNPSCVNDTQDEQENSDEYSNDAFEIMEESSLEEQESSYESSDDSFEIMDEPSQDTQESSDEFSYDSFGIMDKPPPCPRARQKSPISCPQPLNKFSKNVQMDGRKESFEGASLAKEPLENAEEFVSEYPSFRTTIKSIQKRDSRPCVPRKFVREHLKNKEWVKFQRGEELWKVKLYVRQCKLTTGWVTFARENELVDGNVCIFELVNRKDELFKVHIFGDQTQELGLEIYQSSAMQ